MIAFTGATGFVGSYLLNKLAYCVKVLSRQSKKTVFHNPDHLWFKGDLCDHSTIQKFIQDSPTLIHLACSTAPRTSDQNWAFDIQNNLISSVNLFQAYAQANPEGHIIFSSTGGNMYKDNHLSFPVYEEELAAPRSSYGIHKLSIEHYLRLLCENLGLRGTVLRISNPYGTLLPSQRAQGIIGVAFAKLIANEPINIIDSLESVRDYVHLDDVSKAFELSIKSPPNQGECRLFNVGSGKGHSLEEILNLIEKITNQSLKKNYSLSTSPPSSSVLAFEKIHRELGWTPEISLEEGLQRMWKNCNNLSKT